MTASKIPFLKSHWPFLVAVVCFLLVVVLMLRLSFISCQVFAPLVDDAFSQVAMGRNLADDDVWGVNRWEFSSASSSVLWPPLLALFNVLGWRGLNMPLGLNVIAAVGILWVAQRHLRP